jgi:hypothetical protein
MASAQALEENTDLMSRLIDVALTASHTDVFEAGGGRGDAEAGSNRAGSRKQVPLGEWSQEDAQRRHKEVKDEVIFSARPAPRSCTGPTLRSASLGVFSALVNSCL